MKFIYKFDVLCHHKVYFKSFYIRNSLTFMSLQFNFMSYINITCLSKQLT